jgi:hypothetical protein
MRTAVAFFLLCSIALCGIPGVSSPISELQLNNGAVLRSVEFISFGSATLMAKWDGGRGTIRYDQLPASIDSQIRSFKPQITARALRPAKTKAPVVIEKNTTISGQVYVITRGAGAYKLPGVSVSFYPCSDFNSLVSYEREKFRARHNGKPISVSIYDASFAWGETMRDFGLTPVNATTDADGRYEVSLPPGCYIALCFASREVADGPETYLWAEPVVGTKFDLSSNNEWIQ